LQLARYSQARKKERAGRWVRRSQGQEQEEAAAAAAANAADPTLTEM
jgi:hypothetical protein